MSLRVKIVTVFLAVILVSIALIGFWSIRRAEENLHRSYFLYLETFLDRYMAENVIRMDALLKKNGLDRVESFVKEYQNQSIEAGKQLEISESVGLAILNRNGDVVYTTLILSSSRNLDFLGPLSKTVQKEPDERLRGHYHADSKDGWIWTGRYFKPWGWSVLFMMSHSVIHEAENDIRYATFGVGALSIFFSGVLILILLNRFLIRPIAVLKKAAEWVARGQDVKDILVPNNDELGDLARSMEAMSAAIKDYREKQQQWQSSLEEQVRSRTAELEEVNNSLIDEIIERERAQKALERSEKMFRDLVENMLFPVAISTADLKTTYVNPKFVEVFGFTAAEIPVQNDWKGCLYPKTGDIAVSDQTSREKDLSVKETAAFEATLAAKSGRKIDVLSQVFRVGEAFYSVIEDITDRRRAELERDRKNRLEGVMEMAGAACHELNQPLQVITAHLDLLTMRQGNDEDLEKRIEIMLKEMESIIELTSKIEGITRYEVKDYAGGEIILNIDGSTTETK